MKPKSEKMTLCSRGSDDNCNTILRPLPVEKTSARFLLRHLRRSWQECQCFVRAEASPMTLLWLWDYDSSKEV